MTGFAKKKDLSLLQVWKCGLSKGQNPGHKNYVYVVIRKEIVHKTRTEVSFDRNCSCCKGTSWGEVAPNNEEFELVTLAILKICLSESISKKASNQVSKKQGW